MKLKIAESILYLLSKKWPMASNATMSLFGDNPESEAFKLRYALKQQYDRKVKNGLDFDIRDKRILEIGCGHGGISVYLAVNGAKMVTGIDINTANLDVARRFTANFSKRYGGFKIPVNFLEMNAFDLQFEENSFDIIIADNVFEHFTDPEKVLEETYKVLAPGGKLEVSVFSSIWSKNALHLKNGLKVPWANLLFSEKTICNVMKRLSLENPELLKYYPGIKDSPTRVRDLRKYKDLNDLTYGEFKRMAIKQGFSIDRFTIYHTPYRFRKLISSIPLIGQTKLGDILSTGAGCVLTK